MSLSSLEKIINYLPNEFHFAGVFLLTHEGRIETANSTVENANWQRHLLMV